MINLLFEVIKWALQWLHSVIFQASFASNNILKCEIYICKFFNVCILSSYVLFQEFHNLKPDFTALTSIVVEITKTNVVWHIIWITNVE